MTLETKIKNTLFECDTYEGRVFDITIQLLIVISLVCFSIETLPSLSSNTYEMLENIELVILSIFLVEYVLRVVFVKDKVAYIFSFYGLVDLLSILPLFLSGASGSQTLRVIRLLRLVRIFKLAKYNSAFKRIGRAIYIAKEELILFSFVTIILLYLSALGIYHFEHAAQPENFKSIFDCLWWAVATLTTVGYGDVYPITLGGRLFTFAVLMLGLGVVAVPTGIVSSALASARKSECDNAGNN